MNVNLRFKVFRTVLLSF